ncbi:MAG: sulfur carrier protein ThiS adenylyltransferase ThiF [Desulfobulbaceae bacterium]|uniref:Sulfur carrier protein ThiS adenylyltransferase ThiF n=1 Tax=Candidatus Desulfatifera sulfidica TaxID=2841691 RepID=A0A8J6N7G9_9BACT|nr:sulfur carrier protein ThiS adenylyltransferase ThiF [Candidatus Desulfatifera sulfidica]
MVELTGQESYLGELYSRNPPDSLARLAGKTVAIAGAGGLGSNIAVSLLRAGVQRLIIADFDRVELSNLNRQYYFSDQVGHLKVEALAENLLRINPYAELVVHPVEITSGNLVALLGGADILVEAFDGAAAKAMAVRAWLGSFPDRYVITGSGLAGFGQSASLVTTVRGRLVICGDQQGNRIEELGLSATRLGIVAQLQANAALEILLSGTMTGYPG